MTPRKYRALVLDDDPAWRGIVADALNDAGMVADNAATPLEAISRIDGFNYHLVVFDISMNNRSDNREWLDLLRDLHKERKIESSIVVVLSRFALTDRMREAFVEYRVHDVRSKSHFNDETFAAGMQELLRDKLHYNPNLNVAWAHGTTAGAASLINLRVAGERIRRGSPLLERVQSEFDDLLCRLFWDADGVVVTPLRAGRSGAGVAKIQPLFTYGPGSALVLKFGDALEIETELRHFEAFVKPYIGGGRATARYNSARTRLLGGICYSLLGAEEFDTFANFYGRATAKEAEEAVSNLFLSTCSGWYTNPSTVIADLAEVYQNYLGINAENVGAACKDLKSVQGTDKLKFTSLTEPVSVTSPISMLRQQLTATILQCPTHGDLNGDNILVDNSGKTWLIDFLQTGLGHALRDFALLDVALRCAQLNADEASLDDRLLLERALLNARRFDSSGRLIGELRSNNAALQKAFTTSLHIRSLAARTSRRYLNADMPDYDIATIFYALNLTRFYHLPRVQREHGLLAAALVAERLQA